MKFNACPICSSIKIKPLIELSGYPIYQHPVENTGELSIANSLDLSYFFCDNCSHVFQKNYDLNLLNKVYESHYYTPKQDLLGLEYENNFMAYLLSLDLDKSNTIFEIGSSSGDLLSLLSNYFVPGPIGVDPDKNSCNEAINKGFDVDCDFFNLEYVRNINKKFDIVISRHVIEHISELDDFISSLKTIINRDGLLVIETPSLDFHTKKNILEPYHIEHLHVFSSFSLKKLFSKFDFNLIDYYITESGNLISCFSLSSEPITILPCSFPENIQKEYDLWIRKINNYTKNDIYLWGAGSMGITVLPLLSISPIKIIDGNINKKGKRYFGYPNIEIDHSDAVVDDLIDRGLDKNSTIIITSTYWKEIISTLNNKKWGGEIISVFE